MLEEGYYAYWPMPFRKLAMKNVADDVGEHAKCTERPYERTLAANVYQVDLHQRVPRGANFRVHDGGDRIRHVVHGKELVDQHPPSMAASMRKIARSSVYAERNLLVPDEDGLP